MTTKKLVPRASGEGAMGVTDNAWGEAYYDTGNFNKGLFLKGSGIEDVIANTVTQGGLGGEWTRNGLDIYYNGGNVGIGTTDPNYGTPAGHATGSMFGLKNTLSSSLSLFRDDASIVNANAIGGMFFYGNGSTDGINPVSPKELASIECFADENHLDDSHKSNLTFATNSGSESTRRMVINSEGLHIEGNSLIVNTEDSAEGKSIYFRWSDGAAINSDSYLTFGTSSIPTERMRIDANGDVGIGTTNPSARLSVVGSDLNNDDDLITLGGRYNTPSTAFLASIGTHHSDVNNGGIKFSTKQNGTVAERLRIDEAGSVGIGTTSPSSKLHITATHSDTNSIDNLLTLEAVEKSGQDLQPGDGLGILFKVPVGNNESSAIGARIAAVREGGTEDATSTELVFEVSQGDETLDEAMRIDRDGKVGIGTTSPSAKLTLPVSESISFDDSSGNSKCEINSGAAGTLQIQGDLDLRFKTISEAMRIDANGNVGIGVTNPGANLHVEASNDEVYSPTNRLQRNGATLFVYNTSEVNQSYSQLVLGNRQSTGSMSRIVSVLLAAGQSELSFSTSKAGTQKESMTISSDGVKVNNLTASADVITNASSYLTTSSDKRLKNDLGDCEYGLNEVLQVQPKRYTWKDGPKDANPTVGFFAQDVHDVMPEAAPREAIQNEKGEDDYKWGFHSQTMIAALVNATKEQQQLIEDLRSEVEALKNK